jgi:hypothetical protein
MSRGLSDLQRWILVRALNNHRRGGAEDPPDIFVAEILAGHYSGSRFDPQAVRESIYQIQGFRFRRHGRRNAHHLWLQYVFTDENWLRWLDPNASSTVAHAMNSLRRRGLMRKSYPEAYELTPAGIDEAELLAVALVKNTC